MPDTPDIAPVASLLGDPTRGRMLSALMDGRARTATELSLAGGVTASTASIHLARLSAGKLVTEVRQGRHRYFRLAGPDVAAAIEALMRIAPQQSGAPLVPGPKSAGLRYARVCYDHLAGEAGVNLLDRLRRGRIIVGTDEELELTPKGREWCGKLGVDLAGLAASRRRLCRPCLDWSERRAHLAGSLGAALLDRLIVLRLAARERGSRRIVFSPRGEAWLSRPAG